MKTRQELRTEVKDERARKAEVGEEAKDLSQLLAKVARLRNQTKEMGLQSEDPLPPEPVITAQMRIDAARVAARDRGLSPDTI